MLKFLERFTATVKPRENKRLTMLAKKNKISKAKVVRRMIEYAMERPQVMGALFESEEKRAAKQITKFLEEEK